MQEGNERFRRGGKLTRDYVAEQSAAAKGQHPPPSFSVVSIRAHRPRSSWTSASATCSMLVCAGNVSNDDILGSMEFACKVAGAKVVLVMGHTSCGCDRRSYRRSQVG